MKIYIDLRHVKAHHQKSLTIFVRLGQLQANKQESVTIFVRDGFRTRPLNRPNATDLDDQGHIWPDINVEESNKPPRDLPMPKALPPRIYQVPDVRIGTSAWYTFPPSE